VEQDGNKTKVFSIRWRCDDLYVEKVQDKALRGKIWRRPLKAVYLLAYPFKNH